MGFLLDLTSFVNSLWSLCDNATLPVCLFDHTGDASINWESTFYLNLILQHLIYEIVVEVAEQRHSKEVLLCSDSDQYFLPLYLSFQACFLRNIIVRTFQRGVYWHIQHRVKQPVYASPSMYRMDKEKGGGKTEMT